MLTELGFGLLDVVALLLFAVAWLAHHWVVYSSPWKHLTLSYYMDVERQQWMENMLLRDPKMPDVLIQNGLQQGVLFFASASMLIVGAVSAGLGVSESAVDFLAALPFSSTTSQAAWEVKIILILFIVVFSFFKFVWSYRQFNYVLIMIGAAPFLEKLKEHEQHVNLHYVKKGMPYVPGGELHEHKNTVFYAHKLAQLHSLAARHFTAGLNAYFFALAAMCWFYNAWLFIIATVWVFLVLFRRSFGSHFAKVLKVTQH